MRSNLVLTETIKQVEDRNQHLTGKLSNLKIIQRVFKHSVSMQCRFCHSFYLAEIFIDHVKTCTKDSSNQISHFFQIPLDIRITDAKLVEGLENKENKTYTEYVLAVNFNGQMWFVNSKYMTFSSLHDSLVVQYPGVTFPKSSFQFQAQDSNYRMFKGTTSIDRKTTLQSYLQELALIPAIKESMQFKMFLGIHVKFPELCQENNALLSMDELRGGSHNKL